MALQVATTNLLTSVSCHHCIVYLLCVCSFFVCVRICLTLVKLSNFVMCQLSLGFVLDFYYLQLYLHWWYLQCFLVYFVFDLLNLFLLLDFYLAKGCILLFSGIMFSIVKYLKFYCYTFVSKSQISYLYAKYSRQG